MENGMVAIKNIQDSIVKIEDALIHPPSNYLEFLRQNPGKLSEQDLLELEEKLKVIEEIGIPNVVRVLAILKKF